MNILSIPVNEKGRVDKLVYTALLNKGVLISRNKLSKILPFILIYPKWTKASTKINIGEVIKIDLDAVKEQIYKLKKQKELESSIKAEKGSLDILFENKDYMIVFKPAGVVMHPSAGISSGTLANYIKHYFLKSNVDIISLDRVGIVHRLDKGTSGLVVVAKTLDMQKHLISQFERHEVQKLYKMRVERIPKNILINKDCSVNHIIPDVNMDKWCAPNLNQWIKVEGLILRDKNNRKRMRLYTGEGYMDKAKKRGFSKTYFYFCFDNVAYARICTGRTHQIRVSLKSLGVNIIGDTLYENSRGLNPTALELKSIYLKFKDLNGKWVSYLTNI